MLALPQKTRMGKLTLQYSGIKRGSPAINTAFCWRFIMFRALCLRFSSLSLWCYIWVATPCIFEHGRADTHTHTHLDTWLLPRLTLQRPSAVVLFYLLSLPLSSNRERPWISLQGILTLTHIFCCPVWIYSKLHCQ